MTQHMARKRKPRVAKFWTRKRFRSGKVQIVKMASLAFFGGTGLGIASLWNWSGDGIESTIPTLTPAAYADPRQPQMDLCGDGQRISCVVDGDTIWLDGVKIRIADIDTPEVSEPRCQAEYDLGMQATYRLRDLLNEGAFQVEAIGDRDEDVYGRKLRVLTRDGRSIGDMLVSEGLARTWTGQREPWC